MTPDTLKKADLATTIAGAMPLVFLLFTWATGIDPSPSAQQVISDLAIAFGFYFVGKFPKLR